MYNDNKPRMLLFIFTFSYNKSIQLYSAIRVESHDENGQNVGGRYVKQSKTKSVQNNKYYIFFSY